MPKITDDGDCVYRCKECPHVMMGTRVNNWTCCKLDGVVVPLSRVFEDCPLPDFDDEVKGPICRCGHSTFIISNSDRGDLE